MFLLDGENGFWRGSEVVTSDLANYADDERLGVVDYVGGLMLVGSGKSI